MPDVATPLPCRRPEVVARPFGEDGSYLVRDRRRGEAFRVGPEEHFLLARLDGTRTADDLCAAFGEQFGEPLAEEQLQEFLHLAHERDLLQPDGASAPPALGNTWSENLTPPHPAQSPEAALLKQFAARLLNTVVVWLQGLAGLLSEAAQKVQWVRLTRCEFVPRPDDVFIVTYPRSGTTWMQMILYQLTTDGAMDFPHITEYCPWFERSQRSANGFESRPSPRVFKSHLPYHQIPKGPGKYIYVARDGKDVAVSNYHLHRTYFRFEGTFAEFFERFLRGRIGYGSWFRHVAGWSAHRHDPNVLFLTYEELARDLEGCLRRISAFCGFVVPPERFPGIVERCRFEFMKKHESQFDPAMEWLWELGVRLNAFLRAGRVGEGAVYLDPRQQTRFERAYRRHLGETAFAASGGTCLPTPSR
jgi:Sulfotransferase domain